MKATFDPLVSIIIPVYNGSNYMREAIDSALNQSYKKIEILVINDGSNDDDKTEEIALSYGDKIRYLKKENGGVSSALNLGIREMKGQYFSWLSHDDVYLPNKIEKQVDMLKSHDNENLICYCNDEKIDKNSQPISVKKSFKGFQNGEVSEWYSVMQHLFKNGALNGCGLLIPRKIFIENNLLFDETMKYAQDALMWYLIFLNKYSLVYVDNIGVKNRIHEKQLTQTGKNLYKKDVLSIAKIIKPLLIEYDNKKNDLLFLYLRRNAKQGNKEVIKYFYKDRDCCSKLTVSRKMNIFFIGIYGKIRPTVRRLYYKMFVKVKTN